MGKGKAFIILPIWFTHNDTAFDSSFRRFLMMPLVGESMDFKKKIKASPELNQLNLFITYVRLFLVITLPCSPGAELRRVQPELAAHQDRPNACERRLKGCRQTVMYDPGVQYPRCYWMSVDFGAREKTGLSRDKPSSQVEIDWNSVHVRSHRCEARVLNTTSTRLPQAYSTGIPGWLPVRILRLL